MRRAILITTASILAVCCIAARKDSGADAAKENTQERIIYVRADSPKGGNGTSWDRALTSVADALAISKSGDEIWVATGTYTPTDDSNRSRSFKLHEGVELYGGFIGNELKRSQRDWHKNNTTLSGDIGRAGDPSDNSSHVVVGANNAIIDGFTIRDGNACGERGPGPSGPRMHDFGPLEDDLFGPASNRPHEMASHPSQTVPRTPNPSGRGIHTTPEAIMQGAQAGSGGGMLNYQVAPTVRNCTFVSNAAHKGGGVYNMTTRSFPPRPSSSDAVPTFIGCTFRENTALGRGAGVANDLGTSSVFLSCRFQSNRCDQKGGGIYNDFGCSPLLINCLFTANRATSAAAIGNDGGSCPILSYCTLTENEAEDYGPAIYNGSGPSNDPIVQNSVLWDNRCKWESETIYNWHDCSPTVSTSIVEGGYPGASNSTDDPMINQRGIAKSDIGYRGDDARFTATNLSKILRSFEPLRRIVTAVAARPEDFNRSASTESIPRSDRVVYVNAKAKSKGNGRSWRSAYRSLDAAILDAKRNGAAIWIASGTYIPSGNGRNAAFRLAPGIRLYGGFNGNETKPNERDPAAKPTILSGNRGDRNLATDNCYHVVIGAEDAAMDGLTIQDGVANSTAYDGKGGGLILYKQGLQSRPNQPTKAGFSMALVNVTFTNNRAKSGGAIYSYDRGSSNFIGCHFAHNRAENGGAIYDCVGVNSNFINCMFVNNKAKWRGGAAMIDYGSRPTFDFCTFSENNAGAHGGAIFSCSRASQLENTIVTITACSFESNTAKGDGGACSFDDNSLARIDISSLRKNVAGRCGGAIAVTQRSQLQASENTFKQNTAKAIDADIYQDAGSTPAANPPPYSAR